MEKQIDWKERALQAEKRLEAVDLVMICAADIVAAWPKLTLRMLGSMTNRIDTLGQAVTAYKKQYL